MVQKILDEPSDASQTAHLPYRYRAQKLSELCGELPRGHASQHTCRGTHNFDLPLKPGLMEVLLRFVVDLGVVNARLDPALALIIKLLRDSPRVLQGIRHQTTPSTCILKREVLTARDRQYTIPVSFRWRSSMYLAMSRTGPARFDDLGRTL